MRDNIKVFDDPLLSNFEYIAHNILNKGGWFDVRSLESTDDDPTDATIAKKHEWIK
ncbi:5315_t:CDS:2 [Rhizophagus irregularis]|nr:5315_t:CDS:2 [Rhizophagus irregularis]